MSKDILVNSHINTEIRHSKQFPKENKQKRLKNEPKNM